ncbi:MAG: ATP-binding protein [Nitrospirae bacterium]|nr:ATP-binding protein [Nitrospirota bacterium]
MEAAIYSNQGDEYQRLIVLHWMVQLLSNDDLEWVQIEAIAHPETGDRILIEDVVVAYKDDRKIYIQAKKNQPQYRSWSLNELKDNLLKAKAQLEKDPQGQVYFYSRTPFGELHSLKESTRLYEDFLMFDGNAPGTIKDIFENFNGIIGTSGAEAFAIIQQINIGEHHDFSGWERAIKEEIRRQYSEQDRIYDFLMHQVTLQSARLGGFYRFTQKYLFDILTEQGFYTAPTIEEADLIKQFKIASQIGRNYDSTIGGRKIYRDEVLHILDFVRQGRKSILVTGKKGCGKTWVLLELAAQLDHSSSYGLLFIKGDQFDDIVSEEQLMKRLDFEYKPSILVSRLSEYRHVVVIIDSLDALSLARDQQPLRIILAFTDKLLALKNISVVIACRDFDLEYDPYLRNRTWDEKMSLPPLDFERDIVPILQSWRIDFYSMNDKQKALFSHPQNLKLYEKLFNKVPLSSFLTEFHFAKLFIEEFVQKKEGLGEDAANLLQSMSKKLLETRSLFLPRPQFTGSEEMFHILCSEDILVKDTLRDRVAFSHQTLLDYLIVRYYVSESKSLLEFVLDHPQLPFIRPAIRSFLFYLHSLGDRNFLKEALRILKDPNVAYHIKRLVVESLSEINPITETEFSLIRDIHKNFPDLFIRFLQRVSTVEWFDAMHPRLTRAVFENKDNDSQKITFLYAIEKWMNVRPDKVIECWKYVLRASDPLFGPIIFSIDKFSKWEAEGVEEILRTLLGLERIKTHDRWMGRAISKYISTINKGDDLLWQYITQDIPKGVIPYHFFSSHDKGLNCSEHHFCEKTFLFERLKKSSWLLETAIAAINDWSSRYEHYAEATDLNNAFLHDTAWEQKHHDYGLYAYDPINELLAAIDRALRLHAREKTMWFLETEPSIRKTRNGAIAYFLINAYLLNPEEYRMRAYEFLLRPEVLFESDLSDEIGELIRRIVPFLMPEQQEHIQKTILERTKPDWETEDQPRWLMKWKYQKISVIPAIFRLPEAHAFVEKWQNTFGLWPQPPEIMGWGGTIGSPISVSEMEGLSQKGLLKLFKFYDDSTSGGGWIDPSNHSAGGIEHIAHVFSKCCERNPQKYLQYMDIFCESEISKRYIFALLNGLTYHICYRFGRLQKSDIEFVEPLLEGEIIAQVILDWFDRYPFLLEDGYGSSYALYAISYVVTRDDLQRRLIDYYEKMSNYPDPEKLEQKVFRQNKTGMDKNDLQHISINSVRGHIANGVTTLTGKLLENEKEIPLRLYDLCELLASDSVEAVRIHVLELLPYLEYKKLGRGWPLFEKVFKEAHPALWPYAYRFLYHQYRNHFEKVYPILDRMKNEGGEHGAEPWGLIMALSVLDDLISLETFMGQLTELQQENAWHGAIKVFTANINMPDLRTKCIRGLIAIMKDETFPHKLVANIENHLEQIPLTYNDLTKSFLDIFIDNVRLHHDIHHLANFLTYLSRMADSYPEWCMNMVEKFLSNFPEKRPSYMWRVEDMVTTVIQLLRWADTQDDSQLITRVIKIQDRLLQLEWPGMDEAFSKAERE